MGLRIAKLPLETTFLLLIPLVVLLWISILKETGADTTVTGSIFCDQCRDGSRSTIDYPLMVGFFFFFFFSKVRLWEWNARAGEQMLTYREETTNWFGSYEIRFVESLNLTKCRARVIRSPTVCPNTIGSVKDLNLLFRMFDKEVYTVDPILVQPERPMDFCEVPSLTTSPSPPVPLPPSPVNSPQPTSKPFACSHVEWMMPKNRCYWKVVGPKTTVAGALGRLAGDRYGTNITLWQSLQGKGEVYRTLLREGTTALLNSYHSHGFFYPTLVVIELMNMALLDSPHDALTTALRFRKANSGDPEYGEAVVRVSGGEGKQPEGYLRVCGKRFVYPNKRDAGERFVGFIGILKKGGGVVGHLEREW